MSESTKLIRMKAGVSQNACAALAGVCPHSWRCFESRPDAVTRAIRAKCERALQVIAAMCDRQPEAVR